VLNTCVCMELESSGVGYSWPLCATANMTQVVTPGST